MTKIKPHIFVLLAVLIVAGMIVSPVCAVTYTTTGDFDFYKVTSREFWTMQNNYSYNAATIGDRINKIQFTVDTGQYVNFTLFYGNGSTVEGSAENAFGYDLCWGYIPCLMTVSTVTLNGVSSSYEYGDIQPLFDFYITGYARDDTNQTGILLYDGQYGNVFGNDLAVFYPLANIQGNLIYRIDISGPQTFSLYVDHGKIEDIRGLVDKSAWDVANEWIALAIALGSSLLGFIQLLIGIIIFLFVENLLLIIALWLGITMAYSAISTRNIFQFYTKFFKYQRSLLDFMVQLWNYLIQIISAFRGIFRI